MRVERDDAIVNRAGSGDDFRWRLRLSNGGANEQRTDRWFGTLYLSTLGPPGLRLAAPVTTDAFLDEARALRAPREKSARSTDAPGWLPREDDEGA